MGLLDILADVLIFITTEIFFILLNKKKRTDEVYTPMVMAIIYTFFILNGAINLIVSYLFDIGGIGHLSTYIVWGFLKWYMLHWQEKDEYKPWLKVRPNYKKIFYVCYTSILILVPIACLVAMRISSPILVFDSPEKVSTDDGAMYISIIGEPNTTYDIDVTYKSEYEKGTCHISGLTDKTSNNIGYVKWKWDISEDTDIGIQNIKITDNNGMEIKKSYKVIYDDRYDEDKGDSDGLYY